MTIYSKIMDARAIVLTVLGKEYVVPISPDDGEIKVDDGKTRIATIKIDKHFRRKIQENRVKFLINENDRCMQDITHIVGICGELRELADERGQSWMSNINHTMLMMIAFSFALALMLFTCPSLSN